MKHMVKWNLQNRVFDLINKIPPYAFLVILISLNRLSWHLTGDEENYFAWSKQFLDPSWFPGSFVLNEFPGTRMLFQLIVGSLLMILPFEAVAILGRLALFLLISLPLSKLVKHYKIENITLFFVFQVLFIVHQSFFARSGMIGSFQPSNVGWTFAVFAIYNLLVRRQRLALLFMIIATWFHILVGAWVSLAILIYWLVEFKSWKKLIPLAAIYGGAILPFALYLYLGVFSEQAREIDGINLDWVYVYFRNPHHIGLYLSFDYFVNRHLFGILVTLVLWIFAGFVVPRMKIDELKSINRLNFIALSILLLAVIIGAFDRTGGFLKFYPFRLSTVTRLLTCFELLIILKSYSEIRGIKLAMLIIALSFLTFYGGKNLYKNLLPNNQELVEMAEYMNRQTVEGDMFIFINYNNLDTELPFMRMSHRDRFVSKKFVPAGGEKLYEWYLRLKKREAVERDIFKLQDLAEEYGIDFLVSPEPCAQPFLEAVFHNKSYYIYKISVN